MAGDAALKSEGMWVLAAKLSSVRVERFIALLSRESFGYTEWQKDLFEDILREEFLKNAAGFYKNNLIAQRTLQEKNLPPTNCNRRIRW